MREIANTIGKSLLGSTPLGIALAATTVDTVMPEVRLVGLVAGIFLTLATTVSVGFDIRRKWRRRNNEKD